MPKLTTRGIACSLYLMVFSLFVIGSCVKESFSPSQADSFIRFYGSYRHDEGIDVVKLTDGGYAFIGTTITESLNQKIIFYRTDRYGNELWEPGKFGGPFENNAYSFKLLRDGGFAILGSTFVNAKGGMLVSNMYLVRTDERGDSLWTKSYGGFSDETGFDLAETSDGGFVLIGSSEDFEKDRLDIFLVGTDSRGDTLWTRTHGGEGDDVKPAGKYSFFEPVHTGGERGFPEKSSPGMSFRLRFPAAIFPEREFKKNFHIPRKKVSFTSRLYVIHGCS